MKFIYSFLFLYKVRPENADRGRLKAHQLSQQYLNLIFEMYYLYNSQIKTAKHDLCGFYLSTILLKKFFIESNGFFQGWHKGITRSTGINQRILRQIFKVEFFFLDVQFC